MQTVLELLPLREYSSFEFSEKKKNVCMRRKLNLEEGEFSKKKSLESFKNICKKMSSSSVPEFMFKKNK